MSTFCPVCNSSEQQCHLVKKQYSIVKCSVCGTLYVSPRPELADLVKFYNNPAYYHNSDLGYKQDYLAEEVAIRAKARQRLDVINGLTANRGNLLDLGCAAGFFLDEAQKNRWVVAGTDFSDEMRAYAWDKYQIHVSQSISALELNTFDVVTMWEYIEHLIDPIKELQEAHKLLKSGGLLCMSTPNTGHWQAQRQPEDWWEYKPPAHLTFFTPDTLSQLVQNAGYEVVRVDLHSPVLPMSGGLPFNLLGQLRLFLGDRLDKRTRLWWIYSLLRNVSLRIATLLMKRQDICVGIDLYARKKI